MPQNGRYYTPPFDEKTRRSSHKIPIYTPDGGIIMAASEADAQRIVHDYNRLLDVISTMSAGLRKVSNAGTNLVNKYRGEE